MKIVTVENLKECSEQEVFDHIAKHLLTQKMVSATNSPSGQRQCKYRMVSHGLTLSRAAGCLFTDATYSPMLEGESWYTLCIAKHVPIIHVDLISELQQVHDRPLVEGSASWTEQLQKVALQYQLTFNGDLYV